MAVTKTQGTTLSWNAVAIGEVTNISGLSSPTNKIPISSFADTVMKYRPGRRKAGNFTFDINMNPDDTTQAALETDRQAGTSRTVVLVAPTGTLKTITFTGLIMDMSIDAEDDNIYKQKVTIKITSAPVRS